MGIDVTRDSCAWVGDRDDARTLGKCLVIELLARRKPVTSDDASESGTTHKEMTSPFGSIQKDFWALEQRHVKGKNYIDGVGGQSGKGKIVIL